MNIGDLVRLKSGGPVMVVYLILGEYVYAEWFDILNRECRASFVPETLLKVDANNVAISDRP